jgi:hypothetical protein
LYTWEANISLQKLIPGDVVFQLVPGAAAMGSGNTPSSETFRPFSVSKFRFVLIKFDE